MEKRTIIALLLAMAILFVFQMFISPPQQQAPQKEAAPAKAEKPEPTAASKPAPPAAPGVKEAAPPSAPPRQQTAAQPTKRYEVKTNLFTAAFSDLGGALTGVVLNPKLYKETVDKPEGKNIFQDIAPYRYMPEVSQVKDGRTVRDATLFTPDRPSVTVQDKPESITFTGTLEDGTKVRKSYTFSPDSYVINVTVDVEGGQKGQTYMDMAVMSLKEKSSYIDQGPFYFNGKKVERIDKIDKEHPVGGAYTFTGLDEGYFSFMLMPEGEAKPALTVTGVKSVSLPVLRLTLDSGRFTGKFYFGPNQTEALRTFNLNAEKVIDFKLWGIPYSDFLAKPMLWLMNFSYRFTRNYGIDIILLTILIKIIFYPLSYKSYKSMKAMQKLQPMIVKLKEKYKNDKEQLNRELMDLYRRQGTNPLGGCLPMLIQIPVFFALYKVLMQAIEFRHAPFMLWINDLAAPENLFDIPIPGFPLPVRILPLIMGVTMVIQQKMTPTAADPLQEKMMLFMPIFFTFLFWGFPSGLVLYWLINNVISIAQQYYINKKVA